MRRTLSLVLALLLVLANLSGLVLRLEPVKAAESVTISYDALEKKYVVSPADGPASVSGNVVTLLADLEGCLYMAYLPPGNLVIEGGGHTIRNAGIGVYVHGGPGSSVTIRNLRIEGVLPTTCYGIMFEWEVKNCIVSGTEIVDCTQGIVADRVTGCIISDNVVTNCRTGIAVEDGEVIRNTVMDCPSTGIQVSGEGCRIEHNFVSNCQTGIFAGTTGSTYYNNTIKDNSHTGINAGNGDKIFHNAFINNSRHVFVYRGVANSWDDGYPNGGNWWDDYTGVDIHRGPEQNVPGSDGIGDVPYVLDGNNTDRYPLTFVLDRFLGTVSDIWTNILQAAHIREPPMPGIEVELYLPNGTLVGRNVTQADGTFMIVPREIDRNQRYIVRAATSIGDRELVQQRNITGPQRVDFYLPATLVNDYLRLVGELDAVGLPDLSDVDLILGLGFGGPLHETSVYGPLAELENLGVQINQSEGLQAQLEGFLDQILEEAPPCRSLLKGEAEPGNSWDKLLRLALVLGFIRNRVDDAYISIDNVVKATTVAVMTTLLIDSMRATADTKLPAVDRLTPKPVRAAQEWLLKKGNELLKKIVGVTHVTIFAGAFGLQGVDWLLEKCGIRDPSTKTMRKTVLAKVIRFGITDLLRKNFGASLVFEVIFQGARTIGDAALLELYTWLTRGEIENALWVANHTEPANLPLEAVNRISVMDTEHEDWHKTQHTWAVSWFKAANLFRGVGGAYDIITAQSGMQYPFAWESLTKRFMKLSVWLKAAGIGSFVGVIITELRALYVTWERQLDTVYESYGGQSPLAGDHPGGPAEMAAEASLGSAATPTVPQLGAYLDSLGELGGLVQAGDVGSVAAAVNRLEQTDGPLAIELESLFLRLSAVHSFALLEVEGFDVDYLDAVGSYSQALAEQVDLYASIASWLRGEDADAHEIAIGIDSTSVAVREASEALSGAAERVAGLTAPAFLHLSSTVPERITMDGAARASVLVRNVGDEPAENVNVTLWVGDCLAIGSAETVALGNIPAGGTAEAVWDVRVGAGRPGDVAYFWFTAQGDGLQTMEESDASLLTLGDAAQLEIVANSPVRMLVSDSLGYRVGCALGQLDFDPTACVEVNEIEGATYSGVDSSPQRVTIPDPFGSYRIDLLGTGDGSYHLEIRTLLDGELVGVRSIEGLAATNQVSTHLASIEQMNGTMLLFNPEEMLKLAVYYDARYPTVWVSPEEAEACRDYLVGHGFLELDADQLRTFMAENGPDSVVVMAQDAVPDTVADVMDATSIIRRYMDRGGTVVWMQDVPLYWQGHADGTRTEWGTGGMEAVLGVYMGSWDPGDMVGLTSDGLSRGLTRAWNSSRPVDAALSDLTRVYASSQGGAASWFKNFCPDLPDSGFIRLWDGMEDFSTLGYLADLAHVARTAHPIDELSVGCMMVLAASLPVLTARKRGSKRRKRLEAW